MDIRILPGPRDLLGESPVWDSRDQSLYWVDSKSPEVRRLDPASGALDLFGRTQERRSRAFLLATSTRSQAYQPRPRPKPPERMDKPPCGRP